MSCYHPLIAFPTELNENGKWRYVPKGFWRPESGVLVEPALAGDRPEPVKIPCKKCIGCRLDYSRQWADRMTLELDHYRGKAIFLTLTYNEKHVPKNEKGHLKLEKRDLQLFLKRLRRDFDDRTIRYYAVGEYGNKTFRPHYHLIVYGLGLDDFPFRSPVHRNELGQVSYTDDRLEDVWSVPVYENGKKVYTTDGQLLKDSLGFVSFSEVSWSTFAYVSRYVQKKAYSNHSAVCELLEIPNEFSCMSRDPGIGSFWFQDHPEQIYNANFYLATSSGSVKVGLNSFLIDKLDGIDVEYKEKIKAERKAFASDRLLQELHHTDKDYDEYLADKEREKLSKIVSLKRDKI